MKIFVPSLALIGILIHLLARSFFNFSDEISALPLYLIFLGGGIPILYGLTIQVFRREYGADLLAGISIVTSLFLQEYLAGSIVVLMLSGGQLLEEFARRRASNVLNALAKRFPTVSHRKVGEKIEDIAVDDISINDLCVIYPHETCPVDGVVIDGHGEMDESYLTGEPYRLAKSPGAEVISGAVNGRSVLIIRAIRRATDSRFAKIVSVMRRAEEERPHIRRLGDELGAWYTPIAVLIAVFAAFISGDLDRFLAVLVVATPCPLLIGIPVAIIGSISLAAKRSIIIRDPSVLERVGKCTVMILDKTGTLTYGEPTVTDVIEANGFSKNTILKFAAALEQYSKHPLARAILNEAQNTELVLPAATSVSEPPGAGLSGVVDGHKVEVTSRKLMTKRGQSSQLPKDTTGLECILIIDEKLAGVIRFHDAPRKESSYFIKHLSSHHHFKKIMIVSGDRESEVQYLADQVGIKEIHASQTPEQKVEIVRKESANASTLFVGDGVNDAPALMTATVGLAFGQHSDVTSEAAGAVLLEQSLKRVDEFFHIGQRMRMVAMQSAVGGMFASIVGMMFAATGFLSPVAGALVQECIDIIAVLNSLRASLPPKDLSDFVENV